MPIVLILLMILLPVSLLARKEGQARIDSLLATQATAKSDTDRAKFLNNIASEYSIVNADEGLEYAKQALKVSTDAKFERGMAMAHYNLALNYDTRGGLAEAIRHYTEALALFDKLGLRKQSAVVLTSIATLYNGQGAKEKARDLLLRAIAIKEELGAEEETAYDLSTLAEIYTSEKDSAAALWYLRRAEALYIKLGLHYELGNLYSSFANAHANNQSLLAALEYHLRAMKEYEASTNLHGRIVTAGNIGGVYLAMAQNYPEHFDDNGLSREFGPGLIPTGKLAAAGKAVIFFEKAIELAKQTDALGEVMEFSEGLSVAYEVTGDKAKALEAYKQYSIAKDSLISRANGKQLALLETKFETREKDKQIAYQQKKLEYNRRINSLLGICTALVVITGAIVYRNQRKTALLNKEITRQKAELEELNEVKDRLFSVISHDLRTPVNTLITFTQLLEHGGLSQEKLKAYTDTLKNTLDNTARLMENLLNWARSQMQGYNPVLERFDLADTAKKVTALVIPEAEKKDLRLVSDVPQNSLVTADLNMTELLLRNLLNNAIKYTPRGGTITLSATRTDAWCKVYVADTGIGIEKDVVERFNQPGTVPAFNSTPGTNKEMGTGLGLMLCKSFAALMAGRVTVDSEPGKGSTFTLEIPAA